MNFFEHQDRARRNTGRLVALFVAAMLGIIALVYLLVVLLLPLVAGVSVEEGEPGFRLSETGTVTWWDPIVLGMVAVGVLLVVGLSSAYKVTRLRAGGGSVIAEQLGGRRLLPETSDLKERRLLNVVEEMAIASGVTVPPVYLMEREKGINAFAAGYSPRDAVIGVTRGTIETLERDELQGVMAHEFSHILNGDMRLNIRLIGILHGILVIGLIGHILVRSLWFAPRGRGRGGGGWIVLVMLALGAGLATIGFIGTFFGNLIKASVSRQREFLADASAVQFTRHPEGIAGALKKIGGLRFGSKIRSANAPEASHMFFGAGLSRGMASPWSTHPPLRERIKRIEPGWDGQFPQVSIAWAMETRRGEIADLTERAVAGLAGAGAIGAGAAGTSEPARTPAIEEIGTLSDTNMRYAAELLRQIPDEIEAAAREPFSARAVVLAMLMSKQDDVRTRQEAMLAEHDDGMAREVERLADAVAAMDVRLRLPLLDVVVGTLRSMSKPQYEIFRERVKKLIAADSKRDLFEWTLLRMLRRHLDAEFRGAPPVPVLYYGLQRLTGQCRLLLSTLAYAGHRDRSSALRAFDAGARQLPVSIGAVAEPSECGLSALDEALTKLEQVSPKLKKRVLMACATCIAADREVTVREGELLRAISDALDCPMPPLLPGQPLI